MKYILYMHHAARFLFILSLIFTFASCVAQPLVMQIPRDVPPLVIEREPERQIEQVIQREPESQMDRVIQLVKMNSPEIRKFFVQNENREIYVKGELRNRDGEAEYTISYEPFWPSFYDANSHSSVHIAFTVENIKTGTSVNDSFYWNVPASRAGILLSFDDDFEDVWSDWLDKLEEYNARATFFVHKFTPFSELALSRGHDIGYHTREHMNLPRVSRDVFDYETSFDPEEFTITQPMAFAYPYGLWEDWMHEELLPKYSILRGYGVRYRLYDFNAIGRSFIVSTAIDNTLYRDDAEFERVLTRMLWTAKFIDGVLPITSHDISDTAAWGIKTYRLMYLLETARNLNLNFYRYCDF